MYIFWPCILGLQSFFERFDIRKHIKVNSDNRNLLNFLPVIYCLLILLNISISKTVQSIPSKIPIWDPMPNDKSIIKKITAQKGAPGNSTMAWVNTIKARPVPSAACKLIKGQITFQ